MASISCWGQVAGNANYFHSTRYPDNTIELASTSANGECMVVKGLANIVADNYVAVCSISQIGKTVDEANSLMDVRVNQVLSQLKTKPNLESLVDVIFLCPYMNMNKKRNFSAKRHSMKSPKVL